MVLTIPNMENNLKKARKEAGKTQQTIAEEIGVSVETVKKWEQGVNDPGVKRIVQFADICNCDVDYLLGRIEKKTHDLSFIHDYTGLSETAIKNLKLLKNMQDKKEDFYNAYGKQYCLLYSDFISDLSITGMLELCVGPAIDAEQGFYNEDLFDNAEEAKRYYQYQITTVIHSFINRIIEKMAKEG